MEATRKIDMQHLVTFRRALLERNSVRISYAGQSSTETLQYDRAGFYGEREIVVRQLREIYGTDDLNVAKFMSGDQGLRPTIPVVTAIIQSLDDFHVGEQMKLQIRQFLRRLPPIMVKLAPLNRMGFKDFPAYEHLHQQAANNGTCDMAAFVNEAEEEPEQQRRLRVFLACFFLGLIATKKQGVPADTGQTKHSSKLQRIMRRIRGL